MNHMEKMAEPIQKNRLVRAALILFGWLNVGLAFIGIALPGLPTTPFLLVAVWAFARSSERFHDWLYHHPRFGPALRAWRDHRVVPVRAKVLAVVTMTASLLYVIFFIADDWLLPALMAGVMVPTATWLITRESRVEIADSRSPADPEGRGIGE